LFFSPWFVLGLLIDAARLWAVFTRSSALGLAAEQWSQEGAQGPRTAVTYHPDGPACRTPLQPPSGIAGEYSPGVRRSLVYVLLWSLATMLGYLFAAVGTHFPGSFPVGSGVVTTFDTDAAVFGVFIGSFGGLVIGTRQWLALRSWLGITWPWLAATAVAVGVTHALGDGLPSSWDWPPLALAGGVVMAGAQWVALRARSDHARLALASGIVFGLAVIVGVAVADPRSADWQTAHIVAGAVAGAVVAIALGAALLWTSRAPQPMAPRHLTA